MDKGTSDKSTAPVGRRARILIAVCIGIVIVLLSAGGIMWFRQPAPAPKSLPAFAVAQGFVFATTDELQDITAAMRESDRRYAQDMLIATRDFTLNDMPQDRRTNIYVPYNIRWTGGDLGTTVILRQHRGLRQVDNIAYKPMYDPLCQMMLDGIATRDACFGKGSHEAGDVTQMQANLRNVTPAEMDQWFPRRRNEPAFTDRYYLITAPIKLVPLTVDNHSIGLVASPGVNVTGGQLEGMNLMDPRTGIKYVDNLCISMGFQDADRYDPLNAWSFAPYKVSWAYDQLC